MNLVEIRKKGSQSIADCKAKRHLKEMLLQILNFLLLFQVYELMYFLKTQLIFKLIYRLFTLYALHVWDCNGTVFKELCYKSEGR
jgi:hypothetical protein